MHRSITLATFALASLLMGSTARAASITYTDDIFDPATDVLFNKDGGACTGNSTTDVVTFPASKTSCDTLSFTQTLGGFNASTETMTEANLSLTFYNDGDGNDPFDATVNLSAIASDLDIPGTATFALPFNWTVSVLNFAKTTGTINVAIARGNNGANLDFYFVSSRLTGGGELKSILGDTAPQALATPEPTSLLLLGTGLLAAQRGIRRKKKNEQNA